MHETEMNQKEEILLTYSNNTKKNQLFLVMAGK